MEENQGDKLSRKVKESPFVPIGMAGFVAALIYGAYKYKHRGDMSRSLFFVQLRVASQSVVVGTILIGAMVSMAERVIKHVQKDP